MGNAVIFAGSDVKTLKQNINLNSVTKIMTGGVDPSVTATSANKGSIYLSTLTGYLYMKEDNGSSTNWIKVGQDIVGEKQVLSGTVNGINTTFSISLTPIDGTIIFLKNGLAVPESDYSFTHPNVTFTVAPAVGTKLEAYYLTSGSPAIVPIAGNREVEYITVNSSQITAKEIQLSNTPIVSNKVVLDIVGGTSQEYSVDFVVIGDKLNWSGYNLDGVIVSGDVLRVIYYY
jgi:hypothetical protein